MKSPKIRRSWGAISPITKVKQSNKTYDRKKPEVQDAKDWFLECVSKDDELYDY
jgi:hypothetical protein